MWFYQKGEQLFQQMDNLLSHQSPKFMEMSEENPEHLHQAILDQQVLTSRGDNGRTLLHVYY